MAITNSSSSKKEGSSSGMFRMRETWKKVTGHIKGKTSATSTKASEKEVYLNASFTTPRAQNSGFDYEVDDGASKESFFKGSIYKSCSYKDNAYRESDYTDSACKQDSIYTVNLSENIEAAVAGCRTSCCCETFNNTTTKPQQAY